MAVPFSTVVKVYHEEVRKLLYVPKGSLGRSLVGPDGISNKRFLGFLFSDHNRGVKFLQECGLLKRDMFCPTCGNNMRLWKSETVADKYRWR
jgi:hypothetical protein